MQEPVLFKTSILENIRYGKLCSSDLEIRQAAEKAYIAKLLNKGNVCFVLSEHKKRNEWLLQAFGKYIKKIYICTDYRNEHRSKNKKTKDSNRNFLMLKAKNLWKRLLEISIFW